MKFFLQKKEEWKHLCRYFYSCILTRFIVPSRSVCSIKYVFLFHELEVEPKLKICGHGKKCHQIRSDAKNKLKFFYKHIPVFANMPYCPKYETNSLLLNDFWRWTFCKNNWACVYYMNKFYLETFEKIGHVLFSHIVLFSEKERYQVICILYRFGKPGFP